MTMVDPRGTTNALAEGYSMLQGIQQDRARRQAGNALASGNTQGAMSALGGVGDLASIDTLRQRELEQEKRSREQREADQKEGLSFMLQGAEALARFATPEEADVAWREQLRPVLAQMGMDETLLQRIDATPKTRENLNSFITALGGEVESPYANDRASGNNILRPNPQTGQYEPVYTAPTVASVPAGYRLTQDGNLEFIPGGPADPRVRGSQAAETRAPRRSGGGGGGGSTRSGAASTASRGNPWDRDY